MKIIQKFAFFALLVFFAACKKDDSDSQNDVTGKWKLTDARCDDGKSTTTISGQSFTATFTFEGKNYNSTVEFKSDNTFNSSGSYTQVLKTTTLGQTITQEINLNGFSSSGNWTQDGNTLTVTSNGETQSYTLETISDTKLKLKATVANTETDSSSGATVSSTATVFFTIEKI
jgi:hypothetical protein